MQISKYSWLFSALIFMSACNSQPVSGRWQEMFDGKSLGNWKPFIKTEFEKGGPVSIQDETIVLGNGFPYSAVHWAGAFPRKNYEVTLRANRLKGKDIFCGILFPVGEDYCSMVLGGWKNTVVGLSCVDGMVAAERKPVRKMSFKNNEWYEVRLKVTDSKIESWVGDDKIIELEYKKHKIEPYPGMEIFAPFGFFTFDTTAAIEAIRMRVIKG